MRWFARLTHTIAFLCVIALAAGPVAPLSAYAPQQIAGVFVPAAAAPITLTVTAADNGSTVQVGAGGDVVLELRGNPSTGYGWQVTANDDSILLPVYAGFVPDAYLPGSPGLQKFSFHVMAPGMASLQLVYSRPWETDPPPVQTFAVTVESVDQAAPTAPVTVGSADAGKAIGLLPGQLLHVALEGDSTGAWIFKDGDPMIVQQLGSWVATPLDGNPARSLFTRTFIGVQPGTVNLEFGFVASGVDMGWYDSTFSVTVVVPPMQPGNSTAVGAGDSGKAVTLAAGDVLVVRLYTATDGGYEWRVMATDAALLPQASPAQCAYYGEAGTGSNAACTLRFVAQAAGRVTLRLGHIRPWETEPEHTVEYGVTIVDPAPLTGHTAEATSAQTGGTIQLVPGDMLDVTLDWDPIDGQAWSVMAHNPAVLRVLPTSDAVLAPATGAVVAARHFVFQAVDAGQSELAIGLFVPGIPMPGQTFTATATVDWAQHQYLPKIGRP
ncbi:MAG: protease inhibitor I42 family protein [Caldilineaceae bacterium]